MYRNAWGLDVLVLLRFIAVHGFADVLAVHFQGLRTRRELRTPAAVVARERLAQRALPRVEGLGSSEQRADGFDLHGGGQCRGKLLPWSAPASPSEVQRHGCCVPSRMRSTRGHVKSACLFPPARRSLSLSPISLRPLPPLPPLLVTVASKERSLQVVMSSRRRPVVVSVKSQRVSSRSSTWLGLGLGLPYPQP